VDPVPLAPTTDAPARGRPQFADETLLDALAALSPEERLRWNDRMAATVLELRDGYSAAQLDLPARRTCGERD
jgi:hypothetical protein